MKEHGQQTVRRPEWWHVGIKMAIAWSVFFLVGSIALFILSVTLSILSGNDFTGSLCVPYKVLSMWLVHTDIVDRENLPGALLLGYLIPWMTFGFIVGFILGFKTKRDSKICRPRVVYICGAIMGMVILTALGVLI